MKYGNGILIWTKTSTAVGQAQRMAVANAILARIAGRFGLTVETMVAPGRHRDNPLFARYVAIWALTRMSFAPAEIGRMLHRDHSSICNAISRIPTEHPNLQTIADAVIPRRMAHAVVYMAIDELPDLLDRDREDLRCYVGTVLFGATHRGMGSAVSGLRVAARRDVRTALASALDDSGYAPHTARMAQHLARAGYA